MIRRQGRIPRNMKLGAGKLTGYARYIPFAGVAVMGYEMITSSNPWDTGWGIAGVNGVGAGSTWEPEGIEIIYPEND
jgi:hypothetical protein